MTPTRASQPSSRTSSMPAAAPSLRPRNARLISGPDDDPVVESSSEFSTRIASPRGSPFGSRPASPIPSKHPSRTNPSDRSKAFGSSTLAGPSYSSAARPGLWDSPWTALQGLASNVLGSDTARHDRAPPSSVERSRASSDLRKWSSGLPVEWGPSGLTVSGIGAGSLQDREAMVREAKRKDLLAANGSSFPDYNGRYKRRNSDEYDSGSKPPPEHEEDALVYIHRVQPKDTMAGVTIRFNCQPAVLRKANRMWPNDPIQARTVVYLPVDVCGVKGRKVEDPGPDNEEDLLGDESITMHESPSSHVSLGSNGWHSRSISVQEASRRPPPSTASSTDNGEPPWQHDSWVILPNETEPVEIVRLPRRHLGFFPRARRKSNTFSDLATPTTGSLDLPRNLASSPSRSPAAKGNQLRSQPSSSKPFAALLHGPGGVGTLDRNVRIPGPAPDSLNRILGPHLPSVEPPPSQTVFTPWNPGLIDESDDLISFASSEGAVGTSAKGSMDLQELSGAVETWMRRMAKKAANAFEASPANPAAKGVAGGAPLDTRGAGDLIEMVDSLEIEDEHDARLVPISVGTSGLRPNPSASDAVRGRRVKRDELKSGKGD